MLRGGDLFGRILAARLVADDGSEIQRRVYGFGVVVDCFLVLHIPADRVKAVVRNGGLEVGAFTADQISDDELEALAKWVSAHDAPPK